MKGQTYVILAIIFVIIIAVFAVTNVAPVEVNYLFWTVESPLILVILFAVLMGGLITTAVGMVKIFHLQREVKSLRSENKKMTIMLQDNGLLKKKESKPTNNQNRNK